MGKQDGRRGGTPWKHPFSLGYVPFRSALLHTHMGHVTSALE